MYIEYNSGDLFMITPAYALHAKNIIVLLVMILIVAEWTKAPNLVHSYEVNSEGMPAPNNPLVPSGAQ